MSTFALIHGASSDSTHWRLVVPELEARGHRVLLVDVPMGDPTLDQIGYADAAEKAFADAGEPVIVVGHSMGGAIALQMEGRIPLVGIILLCPAVFYSPEQAPDAPAVLPFADGELVPSPEGVLQLTPEFARPAFEDCPEDLIEWALDNLLPQGIAGMSAPFGFNVPSVPTVLIRGTEDRIVRAEWSEWASMALTGRPATRIPGGHSPFFARPQTLTEQLESIAKDFEARTR